MTCFLRPVHLIPQELSCARLVAFSRFFPWPRIPHKHALQLSAIAQILDVLPQLEAQILSGLVPPNVLRDIGRDGLSAQQVLRILVPYVLRRVDFEQLEFHLADSPTYRAFCLLGISDLSPKRACLPHNISRIRPEPLQTLHRILVELAISTASNRATPCAPTAPVAWPTERIRCGPNTGFALGRAAG